MDAITDPRNEHIVLIKSSRTGGTEIINNFVGYIISQDPGSILMVRPTDRQAKKWSKVNFDSMVRDTPVLRNKVYSLTTKSKKNEILLKQFFGGLLYIVGANSPVGLSDITVRYLLLDEVDRFPASVGGEDGEGDPVKLAETRTDTIWNAKIVEVSSPTTKGTSRIDESWGMTDQRFYYVPCLHCGLMQVMVFSQQSQLVPIFQAAGKGNDIKGQLLFDKENKLPRWARYQCGACGKEMSEGDKFRMLKHGEWRALHPERGGNVGFHISGLYSPWYSWKKLSREFIECERRREKYRVFVNTKLGETFEENRMKPINEHELLTRCEGYRKVPEGVIFIIVTIDTQDDRFEVIARGWGLQEESWFLNKYVVNGSPEFKTTQAMLDNIVFRSYEHENGFIAQPGQLGGVLIAGIDTRGSHTKAVYEYVAERRKRRLIALAGVDEIKGGGIVKPPANRKLRVPLWTVGTIAAKDTFFDRLNAKDKDGHPFKAGEGVIHFNENADLEYFEQLTSEKKIRIQTSGRLKDIYKPISRSRQNEALDLEVYNLATYHALALMYRIPLQRLKEQLHKMMERQKEEREKNPARFEDAPVLSSSAASPQFNSRKRLRMKLRRK